MSMRSVADISGVKAVQTVSSRFGGGFVAGTFSARFGDPNPHGFDAVYSISADGHTVSPLTTGLSGIEFLTVGPGGAFGDDLFIAAHGTDLNRDGGVYTVAPDGTMTTFMIGIDATDIAFDTEGILGGGMFVSDLYNPWGAPDDLPVSKIWRIIAR